MKIILFTVDQSFSVSVAALTGELIRAVNGILTLAYLTATNESRDPGEFILDQTSKLLGDIKVERRRQEGDSLDEIMALIKAENYDLAVFEERRRRGIFPTEQDSLVQKVIQHSPIPILLLRQKSNKFEKVLICSGGTNISEPAIELGANIASKLNAETALLHVEDKVPTIYRIAGVRNDKLSNIMSEDTPLAKHLHRCGEIFKEHDLKIETLIKHGVVDETIIDTAHKDNFDLVVLGASWSRKKLAGFLMGDITSELIKRMNSAILIVKTGI